MMLRLFVFFFFKHKTAYEMRISDWSSDVCSSDLASTAFRREPDRDIEVRRAPDAQARRNGVARGRRDRPPGAVEPAARALAGFGSVAVGGTRASAWHHEKRMVAGRHSGHCNGCDRNRACLGGGGVLCWVGDGHRLIQRFDPLHDYPSPLPASPCNKNT